MTVIKKYHFDSVNCLFSDEDQAFSQIKEGKFKMKHLLFAIMTY